MFGRLSVVSSRIVLRADTVTTAWLADLATAFRSDFAVEMSLLVDLGGDRLRRAFAQSEGEGRCADVIVGPHDWISELAAAGAIESFVPSAEAVLDAAPPASALEGRGSLTNSDSSLDAPTRDVAKLAWTVFTLGPGVVGVPLTIETPILIYNKALVDHAPSTFEELLSVGAGLVARGRAERPLAVSHGPHGDPFLMWPIFAAAGGQAFDRDGDTWSASIDNLTSSQTVAALGRIAAVAAAHPSIFDKTTRHTESSALFLRQAAPFAIDFGGVVTQAGEAGLTVGVAAVPPFAGVSAASGLSMVLGLILSRDSPNRELAEDLIAPYLRNRQVAADLSRSRNAPVICGHMIEAETDVARLVLDAVKLTLPMPNAPDMDKIWKALGDMFVAVCDKGDIPKAIDAVLAGRN